MIAIPASILLETQRVRKTLYCMFRARGSAEPNKSLRIALEDEGSYW